jgi:uncharacterized membrane protein YbhN (UPF0104 family)
MTSRRLLWLSAAVVATLVAGYFVVAELKWSDLVALRATSDLRWLALGLAAYFCANVLRAVRFRLLTGNRIPTGTLLRTVLIQNLLNTFLPLRAGEASYLLLVHRSGNVKPGENIGSLLGARVLDLLAALLIPILTLPLSRASTTIGVPFALVAVPPVAAIVVLTLVLGRADALASWIASRANTARSWLNRALLLASDVLRSLGRLRSATVLGKVALLTAGCWLLIYLCGYFTLLGVGLRLPFFDSVFAYSFPVVASMMPFYMLGGFGVFEGSIGVGLNLVGVPLGTAMAAGLALHVADLLFVVLPAPLTLVPQLWPRAPSANGAT